MLKYSPDESNINGSNINNIHHTEMPTHIYIVKHCKLPIFRIGVTTLIDKRLTDANRYFGETKLIHHFKSTNQICNKTRTQLNNLFKQYKYKGFTKGQGRTQWFYNDCLDQVVNSIGNYI